MHTHHYTLCALADDWRSRFAGHVVADVFSQARDELTVALAAPDSEHMLRISTASGFPWVFRSDGYSRARRNAVSLFGDALNHAVDTVAVAERDRVLFIRLAGGLAFQISLFGPRPNVFLVDADHRIVEAFRRDADLAGSPAPTPRPAPDVPTVDALAERWRPRKTLARTLVATVPFFDADLATEAVHRAGLAPDAAPTEAEAARLFPAVRAVLEALSTPDPVIYWHDDDPAHFALVPLPHLDARPDLRAEPFATTDEAVRIFVRRALARRRFRSVYDPLEKVLMAAHQKFAGSAETMLDELAKPSRADRYERWGHLLMAQPNAVPPGADRTALPDMFADTGAPPVEIPLDPARTAIENAERFYDKARRTRRAREHAETRWTEIHAHAERTAALLAALRACATYRDVEDFQKAQAAALAPYLGTDAAGAERLPFRMFEAHGYQILVGKNARQNDALTFRHARPHDVWLHARGVPGSHVVIRRTDRNAMPPPFVLEAAAAIAAHYSEARHSGLAAVTVTERKYVRKAKGGPPGAVLVQREDVLLVEPGLPEELKA